ncbi:hypothetical protein PSACC_01877 [Paramicrosporidium saccamoebae]|uniref:Uncharacterized protein n=1 Tax=Paramicrosporidium saccamoebae TaxID=1246581 RepID=A0A2H9TKS1_9FUNG|nr:hypothetical protein PSACC_01877 [Paramicrosporidium saccamoebae]
MRRESLGFSSPRQTTSLASVRRNSSGDEFHTLKLSDSSDLDIEETSGPLADGNVKDLDETRHLEELQINKMDPPNVIKETSEPLELLANRNVKRLHETLHVEEVQETLHVEEMQNNDKNPPDTTEESLEDGEIACESIPQAHKGENIVPRSIKKSQNVIFQNDSSRPLKEKDISRLSNEKGTSESSKDASRPSKDTFGSSKDASRPSKSTSGPSNENVNNDNVVTSKKSKTKKKKPRPLPVKDEESKKCLEAVDLLADLTKFDRKVVIFALAAFSGNVEAAYRYLNGEIQAAWKFSDDIAILTRDSSVVTELLKTKTVKEVSDRFDFLSGLCDAP